MGWFAVLIIEGTFLKIDKIIPKGWSCIENKIEFLSNFIFINEYKKKLMALFTLGFKKSRLKNYLFFLN